MYCVIYINEKLYIGEIADSDETRYLISVADVYREHEDDEYYGRSYFGPDTVSSDQYQTPRFILWKGIDQVTVLR